MTDHLRISAWIDKLDVSDTVRRYFLAFDRFDWEGVRGLVASRVTLRAPGLKGETLARDEFVESAKLRNGGYDLTVHMNPDHVVDIDGDRARVVSHLLGRAWRGGAAGRSLLGLRLLRDRPGARGW